MESPCVRKCTLNEADICIGCGRLVSEIISWVEYSDAERKAILKRCEKRKIEMARHKVD